MKNHFLSTAFLLLMAQATFGQGVATDYADDAFRYSDFTLSGTARFRALGGNHAALGADASNVAGNPAGLGFYNRSEFSITPTLNSINNQSNFLGTQTIGQKDKFSVGQFGLILAGRDNGGQRWRRSTFGITYSQSLNFNDYTSARGVNNNPNSSIAQTYVNAANAGDADYPNGYTGPGIDNLYNFDLNQAGSAAAAAYQLYIIDPTRFVGKDNQGNDIYAAPFARGDANTQKEQRATLNRSGAHSQWTLAYAGNLDDKLYIGGSIGITRLRYSSEYVFTELPIGGNTFFNYGQNNRFTVTGTGINATLGLIYKVAPELQLGAALTTPSFTSVRETFAQTIFAQPSDPNLINRRPPSSVDVVTPSDNFDYTLQTPLRASGGATFFLGKSGFITATAEYVGYGGMRVRTSVFSSAGDNTAFRNDVRQAVQDTYQSVVNLRAGAEVRAGILRLRAGVGYLPTAYKFNLDRVPASDRAKLLITAGLGIRNERFFADLSGAYLTYKSGFTPYSLPADSDTPTVLTNNRNTNVSLSVGTFF
ncbi:hypothetical protein [Spirosoma pomorum]